MGKRKADQAEKQEKPKRKKKRGRKLLFLLASGGAGALALSEGLRNKVLDALFGSEEQFQYTPPEASTETPSPSGDTGGSPDAS
jgi:hypothetical protein